MRSSLLQLFNDNYNYINYTPECSIDDTEKAYKIVLDVPGIKREDINIEVNNQVLTISGERKGAKSYTFEKRFRLGDNVIADEIQAASLTDGVLTLDLAKAEKARARKIAIAPSASV